MNVASQYQTLFKFYFYILLIDALREALSVVYYRLSLGFLIIPIRILNLTVLPHLVLLVMTHIYRLGKTGKVCSGDYLSKEELEGLDPYDEYLIFRGAFLYNVLMFYWVVLGLWCGVMVFLGLKIYVARTSQE